MPLDFRRIIEDRRLGKNHSDQDLKAIASGAADGSILDYQLAAWLMAEVLKPLSLQETATLTIAMAESGDHLSLQDIPDPKLDKHSTGGVGDKTSIALLPILAACGVSVVKMSGPGLGITGGTVDKLLSIPGLRVQLSPQELIDQAKRAHIGITGQSPDLAPADKALYALRDVTATVDSIPLIVSSILSKKLAGGSKTIVIDVKCGSGAFMRSLSDAKELAAWLKEVGQRCGLTVSTAITDMSQPLGGAVGNALEVQEALQVLAKPQSPSQHRFLELCLILGAEALHACGIENGRQKCEEAIQNGGAGQAAEQWLNAQGAKGTVEEILTSLPKARIQTTIKSESQGWIEAIKADQVGGAVIALGGGRLTKADHIDPSVGVVFTKPVGHSVEAGETLATIHAATKEAAEQAEEAIRNAIKLSKVETQPKSLVLDC